MVESRSIAVLRAALMRLGLSDDEVSRFLLKLTEDLKDGVADEEEAISRTCDAFAADVPRVEERFGGTSILSGRMAKIVGILSGGVVSALIYDLIKSGFAKVTRPVTTDGEELVFPGGWSPVKEIPGTRIPGELTEPRLPRVLRGLGKVRARLRVSAPEVARRSGISLSTYNKAERGDPVSIAVAQKITEGFRQVASESGLEIGTTLTMGDLPPGKSYL